jgi:hypothetical protein
LIAARGFGAPETTQAFGKARSLSTSEKDAPERLAADFGLWATSYTRGDPALSCRRWTNWQIAVMLMAAVMAEDRFPRRRRAAEGPCGKLVSDSGRDPKCT